MIHYFTYLIASLLLLLTQFFNKSTKLLSLTLYLLGFSCLFIPLAFRSKYVGVDTYTYYEIFYLLSNDPYPFSHTWWEPGYILLNKIISDLNYDATFLIFITALISLAMIFTFIWRYSSNYLLSISMLCGLSFYSFMYNGLRQSIAIGICLTALHYLFSKKFIQYLILIAIATLFHYSASVFLLCVFIVKYKYNYLSAVLFWLISLIFTIPSISNLLFSKLSIFTSGKYETYLANGIIETDLSLRFILNQVIILFLIIMVWLNKNQILSRKTSSLLYLSLFGFLLDNLVFHMGFIGRITIYFQIIVIVAAPVLLKRVFNLKSYYLMSTALILFFTLIYFRTISLEANGFAPYYFFWDL